MKSHRLFWQLMISVAVGSILLFSILHQSAYHLTVQMTEISPENQAIINQYAERANKLADNQQTQPLLSLFKEINSAHNAWAGLITKDRQIIADTQLPLHLQDAIGFQRKVAWPVHDFMRNVIISIKISSGYFVLELPNPMRPEPNVALAEIIITVIFPSILLTLFCLALYRHLMRPFNALKESSISLAAGNLEARVESDIVYKEDSISLVASAFNQMATRIQELVGYQRQFLHDLSHELRTPLTRLEHALDLCDESNMQVIALAPRIKRDVEQMKNLVEDTLSLAWLDTQPEIKCQESFDLAVLLNLICEDAIFEYPQRIINRHYPSKLAIRNTNQRALAQSFENVLRNALKYSTSQNTVSIEYDNSQPTYHRLSITDQGIGVPTEDFENIFKPFFRSDKARSKKTGGFGLGLALTKRQIEATGGSIRACHNHPKGLKIDILIPIDSTR